MTKTDINGIDPVSVTATEVRAKAVDLSLEDLQRLYSEFSTLIRFAGDDVDKAETAVTEHMDKLDALRAQVGAAQTRLNEARAKKTAIYAEVQSRLDQGRLGP